MNRTLVRFTGVVFAFRDRDYKRELPGVVGSMLKNEEGRCSKSECADSRGVTVQKVHGSECRRKFG